MTTNESIRKTHTVDTVNMEMVSVHCAQIASHVLYLVKWTNTILEIEHLHSGTKIET